MSIKEDLMRIRVELHKDGFKKNGWNGFSGYHYFELDDILPPITKKLAENEMYDHFTYGIVDGKEVYILTISKGEEKEDFQIPFKHFTPPSKMQEVQQLGATNTYLKKYLYMNAFNITESDPVDGDEDEESRSVGEWQQKVLDEIGRRKLNINEFAKKYGLTGESPEGRFEFIYNLAFSDQPQEESQKPQSKVWQQKVIDALVQHEIDVNAYFRDQGLTVNSPEVRFQSIYQTKLAPMISPQTNQQVSGNPFA